MPNTRFYVESGRKTLHTAAKAILHYLDGVEFQSTEIGSVIRDRCGKRRRVQYLELNDGTSTIRIEVFVK